MKDPHITWTVKGGQWRYEIHPPAEFQAILLESGLFIFVQLAIEGKAKISRFNRATGRWGYTQDRSYHQHEMDEPYDTKEPS